MITASVSPPRAAVLLAFAVLMLATVPVSAADAVVLRGSVVKLDAAAKRITVRPADGKDVTLTATPTSHVEVGGKPATLAQFKEGQRVRATYTTKDATNEIVRLKPTVVTDEQLGKEVKQALAAAKDYTFQQKEKYEAELREVADDVDDRIDQLEADAKDAGAEAKAKIQARIAELRKRRAALDGRLSKVKSATADAWADVKAGVGAAATDLEKAINELFKN